ncbi:TniQ family protein [Zobellella aerophila]
MKFLFKPEPYPDETLESYLLRLSQDNGFESYSVFSSVLWEMLMERDHEAAGAWPRSLSRVNVYHTRNSSGLRVRALQLIEQMTDLPSMQLLSLSLMGSAARFGQHVAVHRAGVDIPRLFLRTAGVPVCPHCINESAYIRQYWHYHPYVACHRHRCALLFQCPGCEAELNYQLSESIIQCQCGYELTHEQPAEASDELGALADLVAGEPAHSAGSNPLLVTQDQSMRFGALLWFRQRHHQPGMESDQISNNDFSGVVEYFGNWPQSLWQELEETRLTAEYGLTQAYHQTAFSRVFGSLLTACGQLPMRETSKNFILREVQAYLVQLVREHPRSRQPNIGDILLSVAEAAALLSTNYSQVYRLCQEGMLKISKRLGLRQDLHPNLAAFRLRHVVEAKLSYMQSHQDAAMNTYLPKW